MDQQARQQRQRPLGDRRVSQKEELEQRRIRESERKKLDRKSITKKIRHHKSSICKSKEKNRLSSSPCMNARFLRKAGMSVARISRIFSNQSEWLEREMTTAALV